MIAQPFLDQIEALTTMSALVSGRVKLTRNGREWKACCPVHSEKTPSFTVNDVKGFAHCFGCGFHAGPIRWLTEVEGLEFVDAVRKLAEDAGLAMPERSREAKERSVRVEGLRWALEAAQAVFVEHLGRVSSVQRYLQSRGIGPALAERFGLGAAPEGRDYLEKAGIGGADALAAGLAWERDVRASSGGAAGRKIIGPRFFGRITVPVHDARGRIVGFGARVTPDARDDAAKYLNSPDSEIFDKKRLLFNLHRAAPAVRAAGRVLVVEGYFDVIALTGAGIEEAVAPMGTALTEAQMTRLWRLTRAPVLMFDGDAAGRKAARRACERALPGIAPDRTLKVALLPEGQDPDDVVRSGGADALEARIEDALALDSFLFQDVLLSASTFADAKSSLKRPAGPIAAGARSGLPSPAARDGRDLDLSDWSPEQRAGVWQELAGLAAQIGHEDLRGEYLAAWRARYERLVSGVERAGRRFPLHTVVMAEPASSSVAVGVKDGDYRFPETEDESEKRLIAVVRRLLQLRADERSAMEPIREERKFVRELAKLAGLRLPQIDAVVRMIEMDISEGSCAGRHDSESVLVLYRRVLTIDGPLSEAFLPPAAAMIERGAAGRAKAVPAAPARASSALAWHDAAGG